jgi:hypothetical protein
MGYGEEHFVLGCKTRPSTKAQRRAVVLMEGNSFGGGRPEAFFFVF